MYTGHAAVALALKARAPQIPMIVLALAAYGPDLVELSILLPRMRAGTGLYTHSVPAVLVGAAVAGCAWGWFHGGREGRVVALVWMLHLVADLVTGLKPLFVMNKLTGLDLYHVSWADGVIECVVVIVGCALYARAFAHTRRQRRVVAVLAVFLLALQIEFDILLYRMDPLPWHPSLALASGKGHFSNVQFASAAPTEFRTPLAIVPRNYTASGTWSEAFRES